MWQTGDLVSREDYGNLIAELERRRKFYYDMKASLVGCYEKPLPPPDPLPQSSIWSDGMRCVSLVVAEQFNLYKIPKPVKPKKRWWDWVKFL